LKKNFQNTRRLKNSLLICTLGEPQYKYYEMLHIAFQGYGLQGIALYQVQRICTEIYQPPLLSVQTRHLFILISIYKGFLHYTSAAGLNAVFYCL